MHKGVCNFSKLCHYIVHPLQHSDRRIAEQYRGMLCASNQGSVQITHDVVTLSVPKLEGWSVTFDREPTKVFLNYGNDIFLFMNLIHRLGKKKLMFQNCIMSLFANSQTTLQGLPSSLTQFALLE